MAADLAIVDRDRLAALIDRERAAYRVFQLLVTDAPMIVSRHSRISQIGISGEDCGFGACLVHWDLRFNLCGS